MHTETQPQRADREPSVEVRTSAPVSDAAPTPAPAPGSADELVLDDLLVEDVSIDGMCGVY